MSLGAASDGILCFILFANYITNINLSYFNLYSLLVCFTHLVNHTCPLKSGEMQFHCWNEFCVPELYIHDGQDDCRDGSDEGIHSNQSVAARS